MSRPKRSDLAHVLARAFHLTAGHIPARADAVRDKRMAAAMVDILEEHGYLVRITGGAVTAGTWRRDAWRIVREATR